MTFVLITSTHSLFNAALARLPSPEIYISAFAVAKSLMRVLESPIMMVRHMVTTLVKDRDSYFKVKRFVMITVSLVVLVFLLFALTGLARWVMKNIMGITGDILQESVAIFRIFIFFPAVITLRNFMQGMSIKIGINPLVTVGTTVRILFVGAVILLIDHFILWLPAPVIAGGIFLGAVLVEGLVLLAGVKISGKITDQRDVTTRIKPNAVENEDDQKNLKELTFNLMFAFFWPLVITSLIKTLARPIINMGLARTLNPEIALSAYAVAWSFGMIIVSPLLMFHQVPINFLSENDFSNINAIKKFAVYAGLILSFLIAFISFTDIGYYIIRNVIGVTEQITELSLEALKIMTLLPFIIVAREFYWGILMKKQRTTYIGIGKVINLITLTSTVIFLTLLNPANPAIIGIIGMIVSLASEFIYFFIVVKLPES